MIYLKFLVFSIVVFGSCFPKKLSESNSISHLDSIVLKVGSKNVLHCIAHSIYLLDSLEGSNDTLNVDPFLIAKEITFYGNLGDRNWVHPVIDYSLSDLELENFDSHILVERNGFNYPNNKRVRVSPPLLNVRSREIIILLKLSFSGYQKDFRFKYEFERDSNTWSIKDWYPTLVHYHVKLDKWNNLDTLNSKIDTVLLNKIRNLPTKRLKNWPKEKCKPI